MIPPRGFKSELYPLRHRLEYACGLNIQDEDNNSVMFTLVRSSTDLEANVPGNIVVNPHNTGYVTDAGSVVCKMSIIDKLSMALRFNMTDACLDRNETSAAVFTGDGIQSLKFLWRPLFWTFKEKLNATDDDTGTAVKTILGFTIDETQRDSHPITTNDLPIAGGSDLLQPMSTINQAEVIGDIDMTGNTVMEDHPWDEDLFQEALRRYTIKGALKSVVGRTRHVTLTRARPYKNFFIDKFVPRAIRRVNDYTYMGIQIYVPLANDPSQPYSVNTITGSIAHLGCRATINYHEWNIDHYQEMAGVPP